MTKIVLHALTALIAIGGALATQSQLHVGDTSAPRDAVTSKRVSAVSARLGALDGRLDELHRVGCANRQQIVREINERGDITRRFLLDASAARQRSAELEAAANPEQSNVDFQAATDYRHMASEVKTLPVPEC